MGTAINRRRQTGQKKEKVLFELYNTYFDGTVNSIVDAGIKLWDGTHNKFKLEIEFDKINGQQLTLFTCKPDVSPYSGIRLRRNSLQTGISNQITISDSAFTVIESCAREYIYTDSYGTHICYTQDSTTSDYLTIVREDDIITINLNNDYIKIQIDSPKTNSLNLLIGCDYKGASGTQRYYQGTIYKFKLTEL